MANARQVDILGRPTTKRLRKEIRNICDSYSHPWDVPAELCQNSVDAIRRYNRVHGARPGGHTIDVTVDCSTRCIEIRDTGLGLDAAKIEELLAPHGTDKDDDPDSIGEKGVGLTFTIYMSNQYEIESRSVTSYLIGHMSGAAAWKQGATAENPLFDYEFEEEPSTPAECFTKVCVKDVESPQAEEGDFFDQTLDVVRYWLRTRTALGDISAVFDRGFQPLASMRLKYVDKTGRCVEENLEPRYQLPEDFLESRDILRVDTTFLEKLSGFDTPTQKRNFLRGKCLVKTGEVVRAGRPIYYYCFAASRRTLWDEISETQKLVVPQNGCGVALVEGVITTATRGMPTSIDITPPATGWAGYWPNFFILLQDDTLKFDLGRKSLPGRTTGMLREIAGELFNEMYKYLKYTGEAGTHINEPPVEPWERERTFKELEKLPDLPSGVSNFLKQPTDQEAGVVALFHDLVGRGTLSGYYAYALGYKLRYDEWGRYRIHKSKVPSRFHPHADANGMIDGQIVIEFKFAAEDVLKDMEESIKYLPSISLLVCWDLDEAKFAAEGIRVDPLRSDERLFDGANFVLSWPGLFGSQFQTPVLALRQFIHSRVDSEV